jgi:hypothetical protein
LAVPETASVLETRDRHAKALKVRTDRLPLRSRVCGTKVFCAV